MPRTPEDLLPTGESSNRPLPPAPSKRYFTLAGLLSSQAHQLCYEAAQFLATSRPEEYALTTQELFPFQWRKWKREEAETHPKGKELLATDECVVVEDGTEHIWFDMEFVEFVKKISDFKVFHYPPGSSDPDSYANAAKRRYLDFLRRTGDTFVWMEVRLGEQGESQRIVFQLFTKKCPMTCENFRHLCIGDLPPITDPKSGKKVNLSYTGCTFFRVVKDGWVQAGDICSPGTMKAGNGGVSVFENAKGAVAPGCFPDECFDISHDDEGILGMANTGPHTNASQFYVTVARNQWMDGKYVAFGRVIDGIKVIRDLHAVPTKPNQAPTEPMKIVRCGELSLEHTEE